MLQEVNHLIRGIRHIADKPAIGTYDELIRNTLMASYETSLLTLNYSKSFCLFFHTSLGIGEKENYP